MERSTSRPRPFVVVLTGGPCSGKSSALALLRDRLSARGFQVLTVPENATHFLANSDGFQPEWAGTSSQVRMQRIFLDYQLAQEEAFKDFAALHPTKPAVFLLDCCAINSKVYLSDEQWLEVLTMPGKPAFTEEELFARYDLVIHMVTCASTGAYEFGPGSNNPGRYHTPEQASEQDLRCLRVFQAHPQMRVVPHYPVFEQKIRKVVEFVNDALHVEGLAGERLRRSCRVLREDELETLTGLCSSSASVIRCTFLDERLHHSVREHAKVPTRAWLELYRQWRKDPAGSAGSYKACLAEATEFMYERRTQVQHPEGAGQSHLTRKVIRDEEYCAAIASCSPGRGDSVATTKLVLRFVIGTGYYELFFFLGQDALVLDSSAEVLELPGCLELVGSAVEEPQPRAPATAPDLPALPTVAVKCGAPDVGAAPGAAKRRRILRPHSTEEAAFFGA